MDPKRDDPFSLVRKIAEDHDRLARLTGRELESVVEQVFAQSAKTLEIARHIASQADLVLSVQDRFLGIQRIAVECKALHEAVGVAAVEQLAKSMEAVNAQRAIFVTTSTFTDAARRAAESFGATVQLVDRSGLAEWARLFQVQQEAFAAGLACRIDRL